MIPDIFLRASDFTWHTVKTKQKSWNPGKTNLFCFQHFPEILWNTPIILWESWSLKLQERKKVLRHKALSPEPEGSYLYIYIECGIFLHSYECGGLWPLSHLVFYLELQSGLNPASISLLPSSPSALMINPLTLILGLFLLIQEVLGWPVDLCKCLSWWLWLTAVARNVLIQRSSSSVVLYLETPDPDPDLYLESTPVCNKTSSALIGRKQQS